jgi:hypothetical protein
VDTPSGELAGAVLVFGGPAVNLETDELLGDVVARLLTALREVRPREASGR